MGIIARVLSFARGEREGVKISTVKGNPGGSANLTLDHYTPPGNDSSPLPGDDCCAVSGPKTGIYKSVGFIDPKSQQKSSPGEARQYGRDTSGEEVSTVWLKNDGSVTMSNDKGSAVLQADGSFIITTPLSIFKVLENGSIRGENSAGFFELLPNGDFILPEFTFPLTGNADGTSGFSGQSIIVDGKELRDHNHPAGTPPGNTGTNN